MIGLLPLISFIIYTWFMSVKDVRKFKLLNAFSMLLWFLYDVVIRSYSSAVFDFLTFFANVITMFQLNNIES